jgi:hypothetical protein
VTDKSPVRMFFMSEGTEVEVGLGTKGAGIVVVARTGVVVVIVIDFLE